MAINHIPGTSPLGQSGNLGSRAVATCLFCGLQEINNNDLILFETPGGNYTYRLETTEIVKPQDVEVLEARHYPELMLVTCYPFYDIGPALEPFSVKVRQVPHPGAEMTGTTDAIAPDAAHPATIRTPLTEESGESPEISDEAPNPVSQHYRREGLGAHGRCQAVHLRAQ